MTEEPKVVDGEVFGLLRKIRMLDSLPESLLARLVPISTLKQVSAGSVLFPEGAVCDWLFFVVDGIVALDMSVPRRGPTRILTIGPGEVLAWSAVLGEQRMTATATALEETRLVAIRALALRKLCEEDHEIGFALMLCLASALSRRLLATRLQLLDLFAEPEPN